MDQTYRQAVRLPEVRFAQHVGGLACQPLALRQKQQRMAGHLQRMVWIMGREQDGACLAVSEVADQLQYHLLVTEVQRRAGLIQQDILAGADQRAGNQHQLLLAAGEGAEVIPGQGGNPQLRQRVLNPPGILLARLGKEIHMTGAAHQHHIAHAPAKSGTKRLRDQGDAPSHCTWPPSGGNTPVRVSSRVLFPRPLAPSTAQISPGRQVSVSGAKSG